MPVIGFLNRYAPMVAAFRRDLGQTGFIEGRNVAIEYRWLTISNFYLERDLNIINPRRWQYRMIELRPFCSTIPSHPFPSGDNTTTLA